MHLFVSSPCARPFDPSKVLHVGFQHKAFFAKNFVYDILDGVFGISLVLQAQKFLSIVPEENADLNFQTFP